eukprot:s640_g8.t1
MKRPPCGETFGPAQGQVFNGCSKHSSRAHSRRAVRIHIPTLGMTFDAFDASES